MTTTDDTFPVPRVELPALRIRRSVLSRILACARAAGRQECMGLLAAPRADAAAPISAALLLPAEASPSRAEAAPVAIRRAADRLARRRLRPVGLWHSHGNHGVYHSMTDDDTVARLLPGMAEWGFRRPPPSVRAPTVTGPDRALLPLSDGRTLCCTLVGPRLPELSAYECLTWESVRVDFVAETARPRAFLDGRALRLVGGGVRLRLGVPDGATVLAHSLDAAPFREATLHSLVVNNRGDTYAEALLLWDAEGATMQRQGPCEIEIVAATKHTVRPAEPVAALDGGRR